ncbi:ras-related protein rab-2A [Dissophora ornata]|nr:ras-related protein rab-2A [Dissophora ornata]
MLLSDASTHVISFVLLGDSGVGKSSLIHQFIGRESIHEILPTVGVEMQTRPVSLPGKHINLQICDTCGQERFRAITPQFFRRAAGILLVYDVTRPETFTNLTPWLSKIRTYAGANVTIMVVGNKKDREAERMVSYEKGRAFADENYVSFIETSATDPGSAEDAFVNTVIEVCGKIDRGLLRNESHGVKIIEVAESAPESRSCC